jgi:hypothetical protein
MKLSAGGGGEGGVPDCDEEGQATEYEAEQVCYGFPVG